MVDKRKLIEALKEVAEQAKLIMMATMASDLGVNRHPEVMSNTLVGSHIYNEINIDVDSSDFKFASILVNDYIHNNAAGKEYGIEVGRKAGSPPPPSLAIAEWCVDKGLPSDNETVEKIRWAIHWNGIKARPLVDVAEGFWERVEQEWDEWFKGVYDVLFEDLDKEFKN